MCNVKERFQNFSDCEVSSLFDVGKMQFFSSMKEVNSNLHLRVMESFQGN